MTQSPNSFESQVLADLAELKTQMRALIGNGQPGRMRALELRVDEHERFVQRAGGIGALFAVLLTLAHAALEFLRLKRP
jgi:hypothetical protein